MKLGTNRESSRSANTGSKRASVEGNVGNDEFFKGRVQRFRVRIFFGEPHGNPRKKTSVRRPQTDEDSLLRSRKWSARVTRESRALQLDPGVFTWSSPRKIARSLLQSALRSRSRRGTPLQSAMSMINFYINRAGQNLSRDRLVCLNQAKVELRKAARETTVVASPRCQGGASGR